MALGDHPDELKQLVFALASWKLELGFCTLDLRDIRSHEDRMDPPLRTHLHPLEPNHLGGKVYDQGVVTLVLLNETIDNLKSFNL
jgi:hypothetical protein